ncbi:ABC transporter ATP-binding protein [Actinophytocola sp.]|uniref:ABC transporter ATP-binding protein n=1 Tax=Actinophytocola sp. TaxID=1872138 RepID=UPI003D6A0FDB
MTEQWRALRLVIATAWRVDRRLTVAMIGEPVGNTLALLSALWLAVLTDAVLAGDGPMIAFGVCALVAGTALGWQLSLSSSQWRMVLSEKVAHAFETEIARLSATLPTLEHLEHAEFHDRLELLRQRQGLLDDSMSMVAMTFKALCAGLTVFVLLVVVHPLMLGLVLLALPTVALAAAEQRWRADAEDRSASPGRTARHLRSMAYDQDAGMEIRVFGLAGEIERRCDRAWRDHRDPLERVERRVALVNLARETVYVLGVVGAVGFVLWEVVRGRAAPGDVVLALYLSQQVQSAVIWPVQAVAGLGQTLRTAARFLWLVDYSAERAVRGRAAPPEMLTDGIRFENVSFRYPGSSTWVLRDVSLTIKPGTVLAVVGENGAGKTTLVKLLSRMYEPTEGRILVDGVDLAAIDAEAWRHRLSAVFQDFTRFEFTARHTVGVGDLPRRDDTGAVRAALSKADAQDIPELLPADLDTQLGPRWEGSDLSTGQWQKLALARGMMRTDPLVVFFDEPTAALDAFTEHAQFERYAGSARDGERRGMITILVTHRFSTVTIADTIVVLRDQQIAEHGSHDELLARACLYADLYLLQAKSYGR